MQNSASDWLCNSIENGDYMVCTHSDKRKDNLKKQTVCVGGCTLFCEGKFVCRKFIFRMALITLLISVKYVYILTHICHKTFL